MNLASTTSSIVPCQGGSESVTYAYGHGSGSGSNSVADPGCLSWIPDLGSRIQKQQQKRGVKQNFCYTFFCSHKFQKNVHYFIFEMLKKKICANFQRIIELFTPKNCH
jgi:hypothetical protein